MNVKDLSFVNVIINSISELITNKGINVEKEKNKHKSKTTLKKKARVKIIRATKKTKKRNGKYTHDE